MARIANALEDGDFADTLAPYRIGQKTSPKGGLPSLRSLENRKSLTASPSDADMRGSAQSRSDPGNTLLNGAKASLPDAQKPHFCTSFTSPASSGPANIDHNTTPPSGSRATATSSVYTIRC
jgi:hypothetical protein